MSRRKVTLPKDDTEWKILLDKLGFNADDRTAVILGGSLVEETLESLVRSWLLPEAALSFLSHFGVKKDLALGLGLIDDEEESHLQAIASIRNVFAHHLLDATFKHPQVRASLGKLKTVRGANPDDTPRERFRKAVLHLTTSLNFRKGEPITREAFRRQAERRVDALWKAAIRKHRKRQAEGSS